MNDGEYLESFSQTEPFSVLNNSLTRVFDSAFGPDEVDSFDASCNTCKHFERRPMNPKEKSERNIFGMPGHCGKFDRPTVAWQRGQFCGFENASCYENRRTGMRHSEACRTVR
jgi:hypothetical protein